jgi:uncharacterized Zn finger protein
MSFNYFPPYVRQSDRRKQAAKQTAKLQKSGLKATPVIIEGRTIAKSVWGKTWCTALEKHADFENRLPRGRTYVRNGSVIHLEIGEKKVSALVSGSSIYSVEIEFEPVSQSHWTALRENLKGKVTSLIDLLAGRLPESVMKAVSEKNTGLFPGPGMMTFNCSCPDAASLCKHVAATLYGIGARLDSQPEIVFSLRGVDHRELVPRVNDLVKISAKNSLSDTDLEDVFGIDFATDTSHKKVAIVKPAKKPLPLKKHVTKKTDPKRSSVKETSIKKTAVKKSVAPKSPSAPKKVTKAAPQTKTAVARSSSKKTVKNKKS